MIDAKTFQEPLRTLGEAMTEKVFREGPGRLAGPRYIAEDLSMMLRYALGIYHLLFYLNADERRKGDCNWHVVDGVSAMPLVRSLIDCLYNTTAILSNPEEKGPAYRKSGLRRTLDDLKEDLQKYGDQPDWILYLDQRRRSTESLIRRSGLTIQDKEPMWPTLGTFLRNKQESDAANEHQAFLKTFTHMNWRQYSALSHGAYEAFIGSLGHVPVGSYYVTDLLPHEDRPKVDESYEVFVTTHLGRAATVLLCMITELQARYRFEGANIDERICKVWNALLPLDEAKELYDGRYRNLMQDHRISPPDEG